MRAVEPDQVAGAGFNLNEENSSLQAADEEDNVCDEDVAEGDYRSGDVEEELESTEQEGETPATPTGMFHFKFANQAAAQNSKGRAHPNAPPHLQTSS